MYNRSVKGTGVMKWISLFRSQTGASLWQWLERWCMLNMKSGIWPSKCMWAHVQSRRCVLLVMQWQWRFIVCTSLATAAWWPIQQTLKLKHTAPLVVHCRYVVWGMLIGVGTSDGGHVIMSVHELGHTFDYALASLLHLFRRICACGCIHKCNDSLSVAIGANVHILYSAGVGWTDTFIAIDAMMQRLKDKDDLDIYSIVSQIKTKQTFMVQNIVYIMHAGLC